MKRGLPKQNFNAREGQLWKQHYKKKFFKTWQKNDMTNTVYLSTFTDACSVFSMFILFEFNFFKKQNK